MTDIDLKLAPGCYGMGLIYRAEARECATCPFNEQCGPVAVVRLATLRAELGIKAPRVKPVRAPVAPVPATEPTFTSTLPKKVEAVMSRLESAGIKVTAALARGENPFLDKKPAFLRVACHLLLRLPNGLKRDLLVQAFMSKLNWSQGTAASHVTQTIQILKAFGAADEQNGIIQLRRT